MRIIIVIIATIIFMHLGWLSGFEFVMLMIMAGWAVVNDVVELLDRLDAMSRNSGNNNGDDKGDGE